MGRPTRSSSFKSVNVSKTVRRARRQNSLMVAPRRDKLLLNPEKETAGELLVYVKHLSEETQVESG